MTNRGHGSPHDRGGMDRYYGRLPTPHKYTTIHERVEDLTPEEVAEYWEGYNTEEDRKDWGDMS